MMEINIGDRVQYTFPNAPGNSNKFVIGEVVDISEFFIVILTDEKVKLKINFKNFENILNLSSADDEYTEAI